MQSPTILNSKAIECEAKACRLSRLLLPQVGMTFNEAFDLKPVTHSNFGHRTNLNGQFKLLIAPIWSVTSENKRVHVTLNLITTVLPRKKHPQYSHCSLRADRARHHITEGDAWKLILTRAPFQEIMEQISFTPFDGRFHDIMANEPRQAWMIGREREKWDFEIFFKEALDLQALSIAVPKESLNSFIESPYFLEKNVI